MIDKHHGKRGPAGPHLQGIAPPPLTEVAAVFQVMHRKACIGQRLARLFDHGVLRHADNNHRVLLHRLLHFSDDVLLVLGNGVADGGVYVVGGEDGAVHGGVGKVGERRVYALDVIVFILSVY